MAYRPPFLACAGPPAFSPCAPRCAPACPPPPPCLPPPCTATGPTGPTGATGATGATGPTGSNGPASNFAAALNTSSVALTAAVPTLIPFNLVLAGDEDGSFRTALGTFRTPVAGNYRFDFSVTFQIITGAAAGNNMAISLRTAAANLTTATLPFPNGSVGTLVNTINSYYEGFFAAGVDVGVSALWTGAAAATPTIVGPTLTGFAPYNTIFKGESQF